MFKLEVDVVELVEGLNKYNKKGWKKVTIYWSENAHVRKKRKIQNFHKHTHTQKQHRKLHIHIKGLNIRP